MFTLRAIQILLSQTIHRKYSRSRKKCFVRSPGDRGIFPFLFIPEEEAKIYRGNPVSWLQRAMISYCIPIATKPV